jgi:hypothetical protein
VAAEKDSRPAAADGRLEVGNHPEEGIHPGQVAVPEADSRPAEAGSRPAGEDSRLVEGDNPAAADDLAAEGSRPVEVGSHLEREAGLDSRPVAGDSLPAAEGSRPVEEGSHLAAADGPAEEGSRLAEVGSRLVEGDSRPGEVDSSCCWRNDVVEPERSCVARNRTHADRLGPGVPRYPA